MELASYRAEAEEFLTALEREYLLHLSGRKETLGVEPIYDRHAGLFERAAVEELRDAGAPRELVRFAAEGLVGRATKAEQAESARLEATLVLDVEGEQMPFRQAAITQANSGDPDRREAIERERLRVTESDINPVLIQAHEHASSVARELGYPSMRAMCDELGGIDLAGLGEEAARFLAATEPVYEQVAGPVVERELGIGFDRLRRSDLAAFFRCPSLDPAFPADRLFDSLERTLRAMGIDNDRVTVDGESRPAKSPRAFCVPLSVPDDVHLVIAPIGGRDDYEALFHESGHAQHFSNVDAALPFEDRYLGDNSVTEGYAFLLQHLVSEPAWLAEVLGVGEPGPIVEYTRANRLLFLRRYCAKILYELELHSGRRGPDENATDYARRLSAAVHVDWPPETWLSDVDPFYYAARYARAWALETHIRRLLRDRFGERWFAEPEAGELLVSLWREGQSRTADELLAELAGTRLDLSAVLDDLALPV